MLLMPPHARERLLTAAAHGAARPVAAHAPSSAALTVTACPFASICMSAAMRARRVCR
jgi:hypothetical protein